MPYRVCCSATSLKAEFEVVRRKVSLRETGTSWDTIEEGIVDLTEFSNHGGCKFPTEMRSRLSGSVIELLAVLSAGLGSAFEPLVSLFMPSLLGLCARTNKVFVSRAKACILAVIKHTRLPSILSHLAESVHHKSASLRLVAAEDVIKLTSRDASANVRAAGKTILETYRALLPDSVESIATLPAVSKKQSEVQGTAASQLTQVPRCRPTTGRIRPIVSSALKGALHIPSKPGPLSVRGTKQPRDIVRPLVAPTAKHSRRVVNEGVAAPQLTSGGLSRGHQAIPFQSDTSSTGTNRRRDVACPMVHTVQCPQPVWKMFVQPNPLPGTDGAEIAQMAPSLSVNQSSVGSLQKSVISQSDPKNNPNTAKMQSATIIKPSSRTKLLPFVKAEHPATRGTSSRIVPSRRPPTKEVVLQTTRGRVTASRSSQQTVGRTKLMSRVRPMAKDTKPIVKVLSNPCAVENPRTRKPAPKDILPPSLTATICPSTMPQLSSSLCIPRRSCHFEPTASKESPVPAITHDALVPREARGPSCTARRLRRAAWQPCRRQSRIKAPLTSFLPCTPRQSISSPLAPLQTHRMEAIARTHSPSSLCIISCSQNCDIRHILQRIPPKPPVSSTPRGSLSSPLLPLHIFGGKIIAHTHSPNSPTGDGDVSCLRGCDLREVLERLDIELDHATMLYC